MNTHLLAGSAIIGALALGGHAHAFGARPDSHGMNDDPKEPIAKTPAEGNKHVKTSIITKTDQAEPGTTLRLGLLFDIGSTWHLYGKTLNDSGAPISIESLVLPDGWKAEQARWPAPVRHGKDAVDYVYEGQAMLIIDVQVPATAKVGDKATISAAVEMLVCDENTCIPADGNASITIPIVEKGKATTANQKTSAWVNAESRLAMPWPDSELLNAKWGADGTTLTITCPGADSLAFMPADDSSWPTEKIVEAKGSTLKITFKKRANKPMRAIGYVEVYSAGPMKKKPADARSSEETAERRRPSRQFYWLDVKPPENESGAGPAKPGAAKDEAPKEDQPPPAKKPSTP